jgi:hypothetical protein
LIQVLAGKTAVKMIKNAAISSVAGFLTGESTSSGVFCYPELILKLIGALCWRMWEEVTGRL